MAATDHRRLGGALFGVVQFFLAVNLAADKQDAFSAAYSRSDRDLRVRHAKAGCLLTLLCMPIGGSMDYFVYPQLLHDFLISRLFNDIAVLPIFLLLFTEFGRRNIRLVGNLWPMVPAINISWMVMVSEGWASPYYAGLNLVIAVTCILMPFTLREALMICLIILVLYIGACLCHHAHYNTPVRIRDIYGNFFFLGVTSLIVITSSHYFNLRRIDEFSLRHRLDEQNQELNASYAKLTELDRLRGQFFANISHELRTPLTLIIAPIEDLLSGHHRLNDATAEALGIARQNALRLLKLINDLLELVRLDERGMALRRETSDLASFVSGVAESIRYLVEAKGLKLAMTGAGDPLPVYFDPARIEKVALNLLTNAIKFTPKGGTITVSCRGQGGLAVIDVSDTGIGIPSEALPNIFDRFNQVDGSSTRKYQGAGIGLALAKELVEEHGGHIEARSQVGQGTTMSVALPLSALAPAAPVASAAPTAVAGTAAAAEAAPEGEEEIGDRLRDIYRNAERRGSLTLNEGVDVEDIEQGAGRYKVLVVDDEPDMRRYLVSRLAGDYHVYQSDHGERALSLAHEKRPDLVLLDLMLPGMDGIAVCRAMRQDPALAQVKIILLTARMDEASKIAALEGGADDFLTKPFSTLEVKTRIAGQLRTAALQLALSDRAVELESAIAKIKETESQLVHSEKMSGLGTIAAGLLHEMNNPLNFTLSALQVAHRSIPRDDLALKEILDDIGQGMNRIKTIVSDLGMFAYRSSGNENQQFDLTAVTESALRLISHELGKIHLEISIPAGMMIRGSRTQLSHVLMNLLANSAKALKHLDGREPRITISARAVSQGHELMVRDNGSGIPPEVLPRIFEPFFTTRTVGQGTGLGLSIVHTIIANHGGTISARSEPSQWTEFAIFLPSTPRTPV
jgi:signal transduction histidine kinase